MRGARRKITDIRIFAAIENLETRKLLAGVSIPSVPGGWEAQPANNYFDNYFYTAAPYSAPEYYGFGSATPIGATPQELEKAYGVYNTANNKAGIPFQGDNLTGSGETIAIVDAYDDPNAQADINAFDAYFNLPSVIITKYNDQGNPTPLPTSNITDSTGATEYTPWQFEETLDIEWAHVMAPGANIDLFEAGNDGQDLFNTVAAAASTPGVDVVSMSWTGPEFSTETAMDAIFATPAGHAPVTFVTAAGDHGAYGDLSGATEASSPGALGTVSALYPASSPNVVAVGGTSLVLNSDGSYGSQTAWGSGTDSYTEGGGGGGISADEAQPAYQTAYSPVDATLLTPSDASTANRVYPDVSLEANPADGVPIYDSYDFSNGGTLVSNWAPTAVGGTGLSTAMMAGLIADADQGRASVGLTSLDGPTQTLPYLYEVPITDYTDITSGSTGAAPFVAGPGYDLSTGLGAPIANLLVPDLSRGPELTGTIFIDTNDNGVLNSGEAGLPGVDVQILGDTSDLAVTTAVTGADGAYGFFVTDGTYTIDVTRPVGYYFTTPNVGGTSTSDTFQSQSVTISSSSSAQINVGVLPTNITFSGIVWNDSDTTGPNYLPNGIYDLDETGVAGATVTLYYSDGTEVPLPNKQNPQITNNGGQYSFSSLDPGNYYIVVTPPTGYLLTLQNQGTNPDRESVVSQFANSSVVLGQSPDFILVDNENLANENAGVYLPRVYVQPDVTAVNGTTVGQTTPMDFPLELFVFPGQVIDQLVTIDYSTQDQSAIAGTDYNAVQSTVDVNISQPNTTGEYFPVSQPAVSLLDSNIIAPDRIFYVNLSSDEADVVDPTVTGTIVSGVANDVTVDATRANVTETPSGVVAYFTVQLAEPVDAPVTVYYMLGSSTDTAVGATPAQIEAGTVKLGTVDYLVPSLTGTLTFPAGATTETIPVLVLDNFNPGAGLNVSNPPFKTFSLTLTSAVAPGSDTTLAIPTPTATANITTDPVQNLNVTGTGTTYTDNSGNRVSVTLSGPGTAVVQRRGGADTDGIRILLSGTTAASHLNISSTGQTSINEIDDDSPLGAISASRVNLTGSMSLAGGLRRLSLNSITPTNLVTVPGITLAPGSQITIGGGPLGSIITLNATIGRITDTTFDLGIPIARMKAASFNNQNGEPSQIFTPTIGRLVIAGNFDEDIQTNSITRMTVGGAIENSDIRAAVSIGTVVASSLTNSLIFAGITSTTTSLPTSDAAFTAGTSIKSLRLRGKNAVFSNSSIAAAIVGPLQLGNVQLASNVPYFGVAGLELLSIRGSTGTLFSIPRETADLGTVFSAEDFLIQVYGI